MPVVHTAENLPADVVHTSCSLLLWLIPQSMFMMFEAVLVTVICELSVGRDDVLMTIS